MNYQNMVNQPHAYYLRYFLHKDINILLWNYRGYGRSTGKPDPQVLQKDSIAVLKYLKEKIGVRGKIGVYGRSLGGIPATFLSN